MFFFFIFCRDFYSATRVLPCSYLMVLDSHLKNDSNILKCLKFFSPFEFAEIIKMDFKTSHSICWSKNGFHSYPLICLQNSSLKVQSSFSHIIFILSSTNPFENLQLNESGCFSIQKRNASRPQLWEILAFYVINVAFYVN